MQMGQEKKKLIILSIFMEEGDNQVKKEGPPTNLIHFRERVDKVMGIMATYVVTVPPELETVTSTAETSAV